MFFDNNKIAATLQPQTAEAFHLNLLSNTSGTKSGLRLLDTALNPFHLFHLGGTG